MYNPHEALKKRSQSPVVIFLQC